MKYISPIIPDYSKYAPYPGRQIEYTVVPHYYPHYFFEGVQSVSATHNTSTFEHGQYTFPSDVIVERNYNNTSGQISLKEYNNAMYVLRGMTGMDPATSYTFDPLYFQPVDMFANVFDKTRSRVMRSSWFADLMPALNETESLDDITVRTIDYQASRKIDFEGYQILVQEWMDTNIGDQDFTLSYPALVEVRDHLAAIHGQATHELCPIRYMLRVIVGGQVILSPDQAELRTTANEDEVISTIHLFTPIGKAGTPVIALWLADGSHLIDRTGLTVAPVMSDIIPKGDWAVGGTGWDGTLEVYFSESLRNIDLLEIDSNNEFANFTLSAVELDVAGNIVKQGEAHPFDIGGANGGSPAQFASPGVLVSRNKLVLNFTGSTGFGSLPSPIPVPAGNTLIWNLTYYSYAGKLPLRGEETGAVTPVHTLEIRTVI